MLGLRPSYSTVTIDYANVRVLFLYKGSERALVTTARLRSLDTCLRRQGTVGTAESMEPAAIEIEYISTADLVDLQSSTDCLATLVKRLDGDDWVTVCEALNNVRQLTKYHAASLGEHLESVVKLVVKAMRNLRSALIKTSLMTMTDLFGQFGDQMLGLLDIVTLELLQKSTQDKKFVKDEAARALSAMITHVSPIPQLKALAPFAVHKSPKIRARATVSMLQAASRLDNGDLEVFGLNRLLKIAGGQINDQLPEARDAAKKLALRVFGAFKESLEKGSQSGSPSKQRLETAWEALCRKVLSSADSLAISRVTSSAAG